jgi:predicted amidohydrolase YtcJ
VAPAELIVRGFVFESPAGRATALAVKDGRVLAIGDAAAVAPHLAQGTLEIDLKGAVIAPGLLDAHADVLAIGERLLNEASGDGLYLDLSDAETEEEIVQRSRARARELGPGAWILGRDWDETRWVDKHQPDKRLLSDIVGANPALLVRRGGDTVWANKQALDRAGLEGSGLVSGPGVTALLRRATPLSIEERQQALGAALGAALRAGVTRVEAVARAGRLGLDDPEATADAVLGPWQTLARAGRLGARVALLVPAPSPAAEALLRDGPDRFEVPGRLESRTLLLDARCAPDLVATWCRRGAEKGLAIALTAPAKGTGGGDAIQACAAARGTGSQGPGQGSPFGPLRLELPSRLEADEPALLARSGVTVVVGPIEAEGALLDALGAAGVVWRRGSGDGDRFALGEARQAGRATALQAGEPADFVVLGTEGIDSTWVGGRAVYRRGR